MSACSLHVGDVGARIGLHFVECASGRPVDVDLSNANSVMLTFRDAEGELLVVPAVAADFGGAAGDMSDGRVMYVTVAGDLGVAGWMEVQGHAVWDGGARRHSTTVARFHVGQALVGDADVLTFENGDLLQLEDGT